jgi:alpha-L-rhamnosidase
MPASHPELGPIRYPGHSPGLQPFGVHCPPLVRDAAYQTVAEAPWEGQWIAPEADITWHTSLYADRAEHRHALVRFRHQFNLEGLPERALARVTADCRYRLWVNRRLVSRGPLEIGGAFRETAPPAWWFYEVVDVTAALRRGENYIEAEVIGGPETQAEFSLGQCGFLFELIDAADCSVLAATGTGWEACSLDEGWSGSGRWECGRLAAATHWTPARVLGPPDEQPWNLRPNRLSPPAEILIRPTKVVVPFDEHQDRVESPQSLLADDDRPTVVQPGAPLTFFALFDGTWAGHLQVIAGGSSGTLIEIACQEIPGREDHELTRQVIVLDEKPLAFESARYFSARCLRVRVDIPAGGCPLRLERLAINGTTMPAELRGRFECSEPMLNQLWPVCRWGEQLCRQGIHLDSPNHQESLGDHGDYLIEAAIDAYAFGEHALTRADLERTQLYMQQHDTAMFHTSYRLLWVWMLHDYWMWTGDEQTVRDSLPQVRRLLEVFADYRGDEGLVSQTPDYMFIDWVQHGRFSLHHPPAALGMGSMTAFYVEALRRAADLEAAVGDAATAAQHRRAAEETADTFRRLLWDDQAGLYADGLCGISKAAPHRWLPPDPAEPLPPTAHVNVLAVLAGIAPSEDSARLLRACLAERGVPKQQPYFMHFVFDALEQAGCYEELASGLLDLWRPMLRENPASLREMWSHGDYSHAWGGTPLVQCSGRILGVRPAAPGCRAMAIRPYPCGLDFARGVVPTPLGDVEVDWRISDGVFRLRYRAPDAMAVTVSTEHLRGRYDLVVEQGG